jgi:hypothetical protein
MVAASATESGVATFDDSLPKTCCVFGSGFGGAIIEPPYRTAKKMRSTIPGIIIRAIGKDFVFTWEVTFANSSEGCFGNDDTD